MLVTVVLGLVVALPGQSPATGNASTTLTVVVTDENNVAVPSARVRLEGPNASSTCETDFTGRCHFVDLARGPWQLRVEKESFYVFTLADVQTLGSLDIALHRQQEVRETVNVVESTPAIDPEQISSKEQLTGIDIVNIPYPNTRDYRYVLNYLPGVVLDQSAQPHVAGGETYQTLTLLDNFNVTQPANGQLLARVSTDAIRSIDVETSRIQAQYGKGPAGVLALNTGIGDDHFRFAATNFIPSVQNKHGWTLDKVDPRITFSGPIKRGKAWFFDGIDGEYDNVVLVNPPPFGKYNDHVWRVANLAKVQTNVTSHDIVTTSFLYNRLNDQHFGFSILAPPATRPSDDENLYFVAAKEQHSISSESLVEGGFAFTQYGLNQQPAGTESYVASPETAQGNFYASQKTLARRQEVIANYYTSKQWHGRHDLSAGSNLDRVSFEQRYVRSPVFSLREGQPFPANPQCPQNPSPFALCSVFTNLPASTIYNAEFGWYAQDRWAPIPRLLIEPGLRFDWDQIIRRPLLAPRLAGTYVLNDSGKSKISAGVDVIFEATNLALIGAPFAGTRKDFFYNSSGVLVSQNHTFFSVNRDALVAPRFLNWSLSFEQELPAKLFLKTEFMRRTSPNDFAYNTVASFPGTSNFFLQNGRQDTYYAFSVDLRRTFHKGYVLTGSYTRSSTRSNQVLDYSLDNPAFNPQVPGPFPWDTPNRFISWGWMPLVRGFDLGYSADVRTGFPFAAVNSQQQIVHPPGTYRFPTYVTLNVHLEKRFRAWGANWALRGGFDNITNRQNAYTVNNNIDSSEFLTLSNFDRRAFTARIRFLGRK